VQEVIAWATFAGAWLLVSGPLYQGSAELAELDFDREGIQGAAAAVQAAASSGISASRSECSGADQERPGQTSSACCGWWRRG
jgi:hypothetical protein